MMYQHQDWQGQRIDLPIGKVVCIGQNYQDHIQEMNSKTAPQALFFHKPQTAVVPLAPGFAIPHGRGAVHNETEIAVLIGKPLCNVSPAQVATAIWGYGLALDLTLRDLQAELKALGRPWELAKSFDGACPLGPFVPSSLISDPQQLHFSLMVNGTMRQRGDARMMIRGICQMISEMSAWFSLMPGDVVLTGTPAGVGPLYAGDQLKLSFDQFFQLESQVATTGCSTGS